MNHRLELTHDGRQDLKPANLLISPAKVLKIGDFGLARVHAQGRTDDYTHQVATRYALPGPAMTAFEPLWDARWYRAPELLFGAKKYGFEVDIWAVGAIFGELLCQSPLFPGICAMLVVLHQLTRSCCMAGENDIDQIFRVIQVLGTPKPEKWPVRLSLMSGAVCKHRTISTVPRCALPGHLVPYLPPHPHTPLAEAGFGGSAGLQQNQLSPISAHGMGGGTASSQSTRY